MGMAEKKATLMKYYRRTNEGGELSAAPEELWTEDFVWDAPHPEELPGAGRHQGKEAAIEQLKQSTEAWDKITLTPDEFSPHGDDSVVVLGHLNIEQAGSSATTPV